MPAAQRKGKMAEDMATAYLQGQGFEIVRRNIRLAGGELDIIAKEGDTLVFVEVKAGLKRSQEDCLAAVDKAKIERLSGAAAAFIANHDLQMNCRFDVVAVDLSASPVLCRLLRDAFRPEA